MSDTRSPASELTARFERDGYIVVPSLLRPDETATYKREAARILEEVAQEARARGDAAPSFLRTGVYVGLSIKSPVFRQLGRDPRLLDVFEAVIGPNLLFWSDKVVFKSDETDFGTPWHQDWPYWKGLNKVSMWVALDDADESNGCLKLIPGSHRATAKHDGLVPPGEGFGHRIDTIDERQAISVPAPAGTAVVFHDLMLHASHPNQAGRDRWAFVTTYKDALADDLDYPAMTAAAVVRGRGRA